MRPVLVRENMILEDEKTGTRYGAVVISYMTGEVDRETRGKTDFVVENPTEFKALGLHKPTRFSLDPRDRKKLPWCEEYFAPQPYVVGRGVIFGQLNEAQIERFKACLAKRGAATS